jgi:hypothetical protein
MSQPTDLNSQNIIYLTPYIHTYVCIKKLKKFGVAMATLGLKIDPSLHVTPCSPIK